MTTFTSAGLRACLVCFVTFLGISAGQAETTPPAVISPLVQVPDPIAGEALAAIAQQQTDSVPAAPDFYDPNPADDTAAWQAVSGGGQHSCGIKADGTLACWGDNSAGQASPPKGRFFAVSAGLAHSCALRVDGKLRCWGTEGARPKKIPQGTFKDVSAGDGHTCALHSNGTLKCWGNPSHKRLQVPQGRFESLSAGGLHTCAVRTDGRLACWGEKSFTSYERPKGRFKAVATGETHACALRDDDGIVCWGNDAHGQIQAPAGAFKSIAAGNFFTCGLRFDGSVACWGRDDSGQLDVPPGESFKALAAGGNHGCSLRLDDSLSCWGSHHNVMLGVGLPPGAGAQGFPFPFLTQVAGFLGTGLVNYGKGVDQNWDKQESKNIRFQLAFLGASIVLSAVQAFLPQPPDPVVEALKRIEAAIQELQAAVERIESALKQIEGKLDTLACNVSLQELVNAAVKVKTAQDIYARHSESSQIVLKAYAERAQDPGKQVPDINPDLQKFVSDYEKDLRQALNSIHEALVPALSTKTSPLEDCMVKSFQQWKSAARTPFDDRPYYESIYEILGYALTYQNMALTMLQDIDLWHAQQKLNEGKVEYSPGNMVGYCATVREKAASSDPKSAFWQQAKSYCDDATALTERTYKNMVAQIERAGAPYTGDDTVLSAGSKILGKGADWASRSWLWVRDVNEFGDSIWGNFADTTILKNQAKDRTKEFLYYDWKADAQAWKDVGEVLYAQMSENEKKDLPAVMEKEAGFRSITDKVFWITGNTFAVHWNDLVDLHKDFSTRVDEVTTQNMKCFIGSGIRNDQLPGKQLQGIVCSQGQMGYFTGRGAWTSGEGYLEVHEYAEDRNGYSKWKNSLGAFLARWYQESHYTYWTASWQGIQQPALFFPDRDGHLARMPVLDVATLKCSKSMINKDLDRPSTNYVGAPTRCGDDLDRIINALVPRPDSVAARVELPNDMRDVALSIEDSRVVFNIIGTDWGWSPTSEYRWEAQNPADDQYGMFAEFGPDGSWTYLRAAAFGVAEYYEDFMVRCSGTVLHGPTGTSYRVQSTWTLVRAPWEP